MKVIVKKPELPGEICEVSGLAEINKLVGNVDKSGNGYNHTNTDIRMFIGEGIDMYVKEDALNNFELEPNLWAPMGNALFCGTIVFAGFDNKSSDEFGACSLTEEQIEYCFNFIADQAHSLEL